ncbi:MAG: GNAT family N-acetyltransferase [Pseudomonadota bacterium]
MHFEFCTDITRIAAQDWNRLSGTDHPFTRHEFLAALERNDCATARYGWHPQHILGYDAHGALRAAVPAYCKDNSYGELVFDWSWADAYKRAGLTYYPKLVVAVPYTPATGARLLLDTPEQKPQVIDELLPWLKQQLEPRQISGLHWLFPDEDELRLLQPHLRPRIDCQYHWHNRGYQGFEDFLLTLSSAKRKNIRRERRKVTEQGIDIERHSGTEMDEGLWDIVHRCYLATFEKKWGMATLSRAFFAELGQTMGEQLLVILARRAGRYIAAAICFRSDDCLYGRHWGSLEPVDCLHFELCYYQGIEYCIEHGLARFEPGAQGEYKISRGFEPTQTNSAHWLRDARFQQAIEFYLREEAVHVRGAMAQLREHVPFRKDLPV